MAGSLTITVFSDSRSDDTSRMLQGIASMFRQAIPGLLQIPRQINQGFVCCEKERCVRYFRQMVANLLDVFPLPD